MSDEDWGNFFGCVVAVGIIPLYYILYGWVTSVLWSWFIVPVFHLPELSIPYAIGISLLIGMLTTHQVAVHDDRSKAEKTIAAIGSLLVPLLILGVAWIVKLFI